ncbi:MAG: outer membrane beta-barrel protein [Pirellulaceae bacterium]|nr:outer membrane beta-barrel protein [Pirellulaceae bacterium]
MKFDWKFALAGVLGASLSFSTAAANDAVCCPTTNASYSAGADVGSGDCGQKAGCGIATESCCDGEIVPFELFPETCSGVKIGGWTQIGYHTRNSLADLFNQYKDHVALHQQWVYAERTADGACGWDWGFRIDAMYGIDADNTQSFGNAFGKFDYSDAFTHGEYGFAIPQVYVEVANGDLSVKAGHFYTLIGYEVVTAPDNFFYSHAWTMNNSEPFTHTGVLATYQVDDRLTAYGGWTLGWDTGFNQLDNGSSFLGGFSYAVHDSIDFIYMCTAGNFGLLGKRAYSHSVVVDMELTERLNYVIQSDLMRLGEEEVDTIGINQYLIYSLNDCWGFGARMEWWKLEGDSGYNLTAGANWKPHTNFVMRPEVRHEWVPSQDENQTIFGIDAILTY